MNRHEVTLDMNSNRLMFNSAKCKELACDLSADVVAFTIKSKKSVTISYSPSLRYIILKRDQTSKLSSTLSTNQSFIIKTTKVIIISSISDEEKGSMNIQMISAATFNMLVQRERRQREDVQLYFLTIDQIDRELKKRQIVKSSNNDDDVAISSLTMNEVLQKLSSKYRDLKKTFDQAKVKLLSSHRSYNHKIELIDNIN